MPPLYHNRTFWEQFFSFFIGDGHETVVFFHHQ
jgi:hypothetical protein